MSISTFEQDAGSIRDQLMECRSGDNIENAVIALSDIVAGLQHARQSKGSAEQQTDNNDYAAALRVLAEWKHHDNLDDNLSFPAFCEQRLNSAKALNCA